MVQLSSQGENTCLYAATSSGAAWPVRGASVLRMHPIVAALALARHGRLPPLSSAAWRRAVLGGLQVASCTVRFRCASTRLLFLQPGRRCQGGRQPRAAVSAPRGAFFLCSIFRAREPAGWACLRAGQAQKEEVQRGGGGRGRGRGRGNLGAKRRGQAIQASAVAIQARGALGG